METILNSQSHSKLELHQSSINDYIYCPKLYYFRYVAQVPYQVSEAMYIGSCVHATLAEAAKQKMSPKEAREYLVFEVETGESWKRGEDKPLPELPHKEAELETAAYLVEKYVSLHSLDYIAVEQEIKKEVGDVLLVGTVDRVDSDGNIIDYKVSNRPRRQYKVDVQSLVYASLTGSFAFQYHVLVKSKEPFIQIVRVNPTPNQVKWFEENFLPELAASINNGVFYPNFTSWICSPKFCTFYNMCVKENMACRIQTN